MAAAGQPSWACELLPLCLLQLGSPTYVLTRLRCVHPAPPSPQAPLYWRDPLTGASPHGGDAQALYGHLNESLALLEAGLRDGAVSPWVVEGYVVGRFVLKMLSGGNDGRTDKVGNVFFFYLFIFLFFFFSFRSFSF